MKFNHRGLMVIRGSSCSQDGLMKPTQAVLETVPIAEVVGPEASALWTRLHDSAALPGTPAVLKVGVNDLGWVVYEWAPGP